MKLIGNKEGRLDNPNFDSLYWGEYKIGDSTLDILYNQGISLRRLITSDFLINNIYNEIDR